MSCHGHARSIDPILPRRAILTPGLGDSIGIASNAARVLNKWDNGAVGQELQSLAAVQSRTRVYDTAGRYLLDYDAAGFRDGEGYLISRGDVSMVMYEHAKSLGIDMRLGKKVADYWENNDGAGIIVDGETVEADCVVCSDGVKSIARKPVAGQTAILPPWDRCITRAWMDSSEVAADPKSSWILEGTHKSEAMMTYYGKGAMIALATAKRGTVVFWYCVHDVSKQSVGWCRLGCQPATEERKPLIFIGPRRSKRGRVVCPNNGRRDAQLYRGLGSKGQNCGGRAQDAA